MHAERVAQRGRSRRGSMDLSGSGWNPAETVFVSLGGMQIARITADGRGSLSGPSTVPNLLVGDQLLFAFNTTTSSPPTTTTVSD